MQHYHRQLAPQEIDHELVWLLVSVGTFLGLAGWFAARLPTPRCAFHSLTGLPCVTCGATRSAIQFFHGHFAASFLFNPLAFLAFCGWLAFDLYALVVLTARAPRLRFGNFSRAEKLLARGAVIILLAGNWIYLLTVRPF
jgi:Protein of unknown function (DUF2752)